MLPRRMIYHRCFCFSLSTEVGTLTCSLSSLSAHLDSGDFKNWEGIDTGVPQRLLTGLNVLFIFFSPNYFEICYPMTFWECNKKGCFSTLANKNIGHSVQFEFQIGKNLFLARVCPNCATAHTHILNLLVVYLQFKSSCASCVSFGSFSWRGFYSKLPRDPRT